MILKISLVLLLGVAAPRKTLSSPIGESVKNITLSAEEFIDSESDTEQMYENEDIVSAMAAEFLFIIAGDHVFLPAPSDKKEDLELHKNAQIVARLLTRLVCTQRIYNLLNETTQEMDMQWWSKSKEQQHPFLKIFQRVFEELKSDPETHAELLREQNEMKNESLVDLSEFHRDNTVPTATKETFYTEFEEVDKLLESDLVKKVVLAVELLKVSALPLAEVPKSVPQLRKQMQTAKGVFKLASSENKEIRERMQKIFDKVLNDTVDHFGVIFSSKYHDFFCELLLKEMERDEVVIQEYYCVKDFLQ